MQASLTSHRGRRRPAASMKRKGIRMIFVRARRPGSNPASRLPVEMLDCHVCPLCVQQRRARSRSSRGVAMPRR